jgi:glycosyltransferase involved in cell wall biosynthesis
MDSRDCDAMGELGLLSGTVPFPLKHNVHTGVFSYKEILYMLRNNVRHIARNAKLGLFINLLDCYYSSEMRDLITNLVTYKRFDAIITTRPMVNYVLDMKIPTFIYPLDAVYFWHKQNYIKSTRMQKLLTGLLYILTKEYEKRIYPYIDACLVVTEEDKQLLEELNPIIKCNVLPCGIDTDYFRPDAEVGEDEASLVFVSGMSSYPSKVNVLSFYRNTFPLIRNEIPSVQLYLVGRDPIREIIDLGRDPNVIVTGFVDDVRPYLAKASVIIAPLVLGTGIKLKVLEAMAMGKPVVTTSVGIQGIVGVNGRDCIVSDDPHEYACHVVKLLKDPGLRATLGRNARSNMERIYSWTRIAGNFNDIMLRTLTQYN